MTHHTARPPVDAALKEPLSALAEQLPASMTPEMIPMMRRGGPTDVTPETIAEHGLVQRDVTIEGFEGAPIIVSIIARATHAAHGAGIFHVHAGGMVAGTRMTGLAAMLPWIVKHDAVW